MQARVQAAGRQQLGMPALFDDAPVSITTMRSARSMVDRRCAMTRLVRPCISALERLPAPARSDSESSAEVASSRIRIGASL